VKSTYTELCRALFKYETLTLDPLTVETECKLDLEEFLKYLGLEVSIVGSDDICVLDVDVTYDSYAKVSLL
jgi:hypothetical protein